MTPDSTAAAAPAAVLLELIKVQSSTFPSTVIMLLLQFIALGSQETRRTKANHMLLSSNKYTLIFFYIKQAFGSDSRRETLDPQL